MPNLLSARFDNGDETCSLRARLDRSVDGIHITRSLVLSGRLSTVNVEVFEQDLFTTRAHEAVLIADNPLIPGPERESLDSNGLIKVGTVVGPASVLASILQFDLLAATNPPAQGFRRAEDDSLKCPAEWAGAMVEAANYKTRAEIEGKPQSTLTGRVRIKLRQVMQIAVGDVLLLGEHPAIISGITEAENGADILVDEEVAGQIGLLAGQTALVAATVAAPPASWAVQARLVARYSLITQQPLGGRMRTPGQKVGPAHVHTLNLLGLRENLAGILTVKSDDVGGRVALRKAALGKGAFPAPGAPASFQVFLCELTALGFMPTPRSAGDHVMLGLQFMTDLDRLTLSHGRVSKPETMDFRTFKMIDGGFMCETIFGPENSPERRTRFGRIDLPAPIVPYLFRMPGNDGSPSLLSRTLKISDDEIGGLLEHNLQLDENDAIVSFTAAAPWKSGAEAIERLVTLVPDADLPGGLGQRANGRSALTPRAALVLPPDLRPLVLLHNGNFATADSNDLYRRLLNRANRLAKLIELKAPQQVILYERFQLQQAADQLFANGLLPPKRRIGGTKGEPLKDILSWMHFRVQGRNSKRVDYSARARTVFRRDLPVDIALVPRSIAVTLELPEHSPILLTRDAEAGEQSTPILIARAVTHDDPAIVLNSAHGAMLFGGVDSIPESVLHRPMLPGAIEEAEEHVGKLLRAKDPLPPSWLNTPSPVSVALDVVIAAAAGEELSFDCPTGILAAGPGCITITPVVEARQSSNKVDIAFP